MQNLERSVPAKNKIAQHTINSKPLAKKRSYYDDYFNYGTNDRQPLTETTIENWARELTTWCLDPKNDARFVADWRRTKQISRFDWRRLREKFPRLQEACDEVNEYIGQKLYTRAVDNKANWSAVRHSLYQHAPEFLEAEKFHADLKKEVEETKVQLALMMINNTKEGDEHRMKLGNKQKKAITVEQE